MASFSLWCSARPAHSIKLGFHLNPAWLPNSSSLNLHSTSVFRFTNAERLAIRRLALVRASNKPSESVENTQVSRSGDASSTQGPPFLTILAGIVVFGLVVWSIGSLVLWLVGFLTLIFSK